jgi:competence protein ComEA
VSAPPAPDPRRARLRAGAGAALVLVLLGLAAAVLVTALAPHGGSTVVAPTAGASADATEGPAGVVSSPTPGVLYVQVVGQVAHPGLYEIRDGDRVMDAVAAAGGFTPHADQAGINLARLVADGEQLVVPAVGEAPPAGAGGGPGGGGSAGGPAAKVNINTADETTLETLPRVGPAMAQKIIDWRTKNGRFRSIQDLRSVSGIGDATFAQLEPLVTV